VACRTRFAKFSGNKKGRPCGRGKKRINEKVQTRRNMVCVGTRVPMPIACGLDAKVFGSSTDGHSLTAAATIGLVKAITRPQFRHRRRHGRRRGSAFMRSGTRFALAGNCASPYPAGPKDKLRPAVPTALFAVDGGFFMPRFCPSGLVGPVSTRRAPSGQPENHRHILTAPKQTAHHRAACPAA